MPIYSGNKKLKKLYIGNQAVKKAYIGNQLIYSAGNIVTYNVDTGVRYQEEVDEGESCLSPKTFTPQKAGWTFVGWRMDMVASGDVLASKVMGDNPVTLYAVFSYNVTVTYYNGSSSASSQTKNRYWNNGNAASPSFTLTQVSLSGWAARGWSTSTMADSGITYNNGTAFTRDSNVTLYGMYQQTITLTIYNGSATASRQTGTRYYCPGSGNIVNPAFTVTPAAISGWTFNGWASSSGAAAEIVYSSISGRIFSANAAVYARYSQTITLSYNGNGASGGSTAAQTGTRYFNSGNYLNPSFILLANGFTKTGYAWTKWAMGSAGGTQYANGATVVLSSSTIFYAVWTALDFTMDLDTNGWTKEIIQGGFADGGPSIRSNPYGDGGIEIIGKGTGGSTTAYDIGGYSRKIDTKGLSKMDINLGAYSSDKGIIRCGDVEIDLYQNVSNLKNISISVSPTTQKLCLYINDRGDTYHTHSIIVKSIYFHN